MATIVTKPIEESLVFAGADVPAGSAVVFLQGEATGGGDLPLGFTRDGDQGLVTLFSSGEQVDLLPIDAAINFTGSSANLFTYNDPLVEVYRDAELAREAAFIEAHPGVPLWDVAATSGPTDDAPGDTTDDSADGPGQTDDVPPVVDDGGVTQPDDGTVPPVAGDDGTTEDPDGVTDTGTGNTDDDPTIPPVADADDPGLPKFDDVMVAATQLTKDLIGGAPLPQLLSDFHALNTELLGYIGSVYASHAADGITDPEAGRAFGEALGEKIGDAIREALGGADHATDDGQTDGTTTPPVNPDLIPGSDVVTDAPEEGQGQAGGQHEDHGHGHGWGHADDGGHDRGFGHGCGAGSHDHGVPA